MEHIIYMPDLKIGSIPLGEHDLDWFTVMSKLGNRSIRANAGSVIGFYVRRRKDEYREILAYTARKYGLTEGEVFRRILNNEDLGEVVEDFEAMPPEINDEG